MKLLSTVNSNSSSRKAKKSFKEKQIKIKLVNRCFCCIFKCIVTFSFLVGIRQAQIHINSFSIKQITYDTHMNNNKTKTYFRSLNIRSFKWKIPLFHVWCKVKYNISYETKNKFFFLLKLTNGKPGKWQQIARFMVFNFWNSSIRFTRNLLVLQKVSFFIFTSSLMSSNIC